MKTSEMKKALRVLTQGEKEVYEARKAMIEANLRLVISIAKRYLGRGFELFRPDTGGQQRAYEGGRQVRVQEGI